MAGLRSFTVLTRVHISAADQMDADATITRGLELLMRQDLIKAYDPPIFVTQAMSSAGEVLEQIVIKHQCECGGDKEAYLHGESLSHISWSRRDR